MKITLHIASNHYNAHFYVNDIRHNVVASCEAFLVKNAIAKLKELGLSGVLVKVYEWRITYYTKSDGTRTVTVWVKNHADALEIAKKNDDFDCLA